MATKRSGPSLLKSFRKRHGLTLRAASRALGVTHVAVLQWETGDNAPAMSFRAAIETWSGGEIPAASWPLGKREARLTARAARVEPFKPSAA